MKYLLLITMYHFVFSQSHVFSEAQKEFRTSQGKMRYRVGGNINFISNNPDDYILPEFNISVKNSIDTIDASYRSIFRAQVALHQLKEEILSDKILYDFSFIFEVLDEKGRRINDRTFRKNLVLDKSNYKNYYYNYHKEEYFRKLDQGNYELRVTLIDNHSNAQTTKKTSFEVKSYYRDKLLISDMRFFDSSTNKEIKSAENTYKNFDDDIIVYFETYKKGTDYRFQYDLTMFREKKASEALIDFLVNDLFLAFMKIDYFFTEDKRSIDFDTIVFDEDKKYNEFYINVPKEIFKEYAFLESHYGQRFIEIALIPQLIIANRVYSNEQENDILNYRKMTDSNYVNQRITSDIDEIIIIDTKEELNSHFSITWDSVPNNEAAYEYSFNLLKILMNDDEIERLDTIPNNHKKELYFDVLKRLSSKENRMDVFNYFNLFLKRIEFAKMNFFDVKYDPLTKVWLKSDVIKDGWLSDKGYIYLKYGLADEISGENFISKENLIIYSLLPVRQRWYYKYLDREFYFFNNMLIK